MEEGCSLDTLCDDLRLLLFSFSVVLFIVVEPLPSHMQGVSQLLPLAEVTPTLIRRRDKPTGIFGPLHETNEKYGVLAINDASRRTPPSRRVFKRDPCGYPATEAVEPVTYVSAAGVHLQYRVNSRHVTSRTSSRCCALQVEPTSHRQSIYRYSIAGRMSPDHDEQPARELMGWPYAAPQVLMKNEAVQTS